MAFGILHFRENVSFVMPTRNPNRITFDLIRILSLYLHQLTYSRLYRFSSTSSDELLTFFYANPKFRFKLCLFNLKCIKFTEKKLDIYYQFHYTRPICGFSIFFSIFMRKIEAISRHLCKTLFTESFKIDESIKKYTLNENFCMISNRALVRMIVCFDL